MIPELAHVHRARLVVIPERVGTPNSGMVGAYGVAFPVYFSFLRQLVIASFNRWGVDGSRGLVAIGACG